MTMECRVYGCATYPLAARRRFSHPRRRIMKVSPFHLTATTSISARLRTRCIHSSTFTDPPFFGGTPQTIVQYIDSDISFSPDGQHIAYLRRNNPEVGTYRVFAASSEGN